MIGEKEAVNTASFPPPIFSIPLFPYQMDAVRFGYPCKAEAAAAILSAAGSRAHHGQSVYYHSAAAEAALIVNRNGTRDA